MGVDLFAGSLQRYYTRHWETPGGAAARAQGLDYRMAYTLENDPAPLEERAVAAGVRDFAKRLQPKLELSDGPFWNESPDLPYMSLRLTYEGLGALLLWTAQLYRPDLPRPLRLPADPWRAPAVAEAVEGGYYAGPMAVFEVNMVVPGGAERISSEVDPRGHTLSVTTSATLKQAIRAVAPSLHLRASSAERIVEAGPPPSGFAVGRRGRRWFEVYKARRQRSEPPPPEDEVRSLAVYALSCFMVMNRFATEHAVPIVRDD
ncbi:MAG: hypothetical protein QNJ30_22925 [Kiloniellales bacterium]|nr:hypothetical protein [Kiloniellales bacterium]